MTSKKVKRKKQKSLNREGLLKKAFSGDKKKSSEEDIVEET